jgi:hypothetical protein
MSKQQAVRILQQQMHSIATEARQALPELNGWIKCSDRLPPVRQRVLAYRLGKKTNDGPFFAMTCGNEHRPWRYIDGDRCDITPTHWHEIPVPPTE